MPVILEKFLMGKNDSPEDGMYIGDHFLSVVDGVTSKGTHSYQGHTSGWYAKELILERLKTLPADIDAAGAMQTLNNAIRDGYGDYLPIAKENAANRIQACVILFSVAKNEIWVFGDCQCIINGKLYKNEKLFDDVVAKMRALVLEIDRLQGKTEAELMAHDTGREFIMPILQKQNILTNAPTRFGFDTLDGISELCLERLKRFKINPGDCVVLSSDGYPYLKNTLEGSEAALEKVLSEDPLCDVGYLSTKGLTPGNSSFDDRTYLKFIV